MGGAWERLVRSVKTSLYAALPTRNPSDALLQSFLIEIEHCINSRPLTYLPIDSEEDDALTPNHFIHAYYNQGHQLGEFTNDTQLLKFNWMTSQVVANRFWKRWIREYLPNLNRRAKWCKPAQPLKEGDIVIIVDQNNPRNLWPKGRIIAVKTGKDGQVRSATVKTIGGTYERPTVKLAKIDVQVGANPDGLAPGGSVVKNLNSAPNRDEM